MQQAKVDQETSIPFFHVNPLSVNTYALLETLLGALRGRNSGWPPFLPRQYVMPEPYKESN